MPFEHRIIQDEEDEFLLECDNVEALFDLEFLADQLRDDATYLAASYPAEIHGTATADSQPAASNRASSVDETKANVERQRERCLSRVDELLNERNHSARSGWLNWLASGVAVAAVAMIISAVAWRAQVPQVVGRNLSDQRPGVTSIEMEHIDQAGPLEHSSGEQFNSGSPHDGPFLTSSTALGNPVSTTPVVFEMPAVFRSASEPEMEALLDLYDSETAAPVAIGF